MNTLASALALASAVAAACIPTPASANLLANGSFENLQGTWVDNSGGLGFMKWRYGEAGVVPGWGVAWPGRDVIWVADGNPFGTTASDGGFHIDLTGSTDGPTFNGVFAEFATTPGQSYRLGLDLGVHNGPCGGVDCTGPVGVAVVVLGALSRQILDFAPDGAGQQWRRFEFEFVAAEPISHLRIDGVQGAGKRYIGLDNIAVNATAVLAVPEPATWASMAAGLVLALGLARRSAVR
jgi:hypothetical protein